MTPSHTPVQAAGLEDQQIIELIYEHYRDHPLVIELVERFEPYKEEA